VPNADLGQNPHTTAVKGHIAHKSKRLSEGTLTVERNNCSNPDFYDIL